MDWDYTIDSQRRLVTVVVGGGLTDADVIEVSARVRDDPDFSPDCMQLVDLRSANGLDWTASGVKKMVARGTRLSAESRRAIVVSTDLAYWIGRLFVVTSDEKAGQIQIFKDMDEARRWLGLL